MNIPNRNNPEQAYRDLEKMRQLNVKWLRTGINTPDMIDHWGEGGKVVIEKETIDIYIKFLKKAKSYNMKIILMSVEAYGGDQSSYSNYLHETKQYWELITKPLSPYVDIWQVYNEPDGINYRTYEPIKEENKKRTSNNLIIQSANSGK